MKKNKENTENERLIEILGFLKENGLIYNESDFCKKIEIVRSFLSDMKSGRKPVSEQMILRIEQAFPMVNGNWILTGAGDKIRNNSSQNIEGDGNIQVGGNYHNSNEGKTIDELVSLLKKRDEQIDRLISLLEKKEQ